jgi:hypothetical protein
MTYLDKAKKFVKSGFWMAGYGHFDVTIDEIALIFELVEKSDFKSLKDLYSKLEEERL